MASYIEALSEALIYAVLHNNVPLARQALLRGANPETTGAMQTPVLHLALSHCDDDMVEELLKAGANPLNIDSSCRSALVLAQCMGRREAAAMMQATA